jgi:hypothetical protein
MCPPARRAAIDVVAPDPSHISHNQRHTAASSGIWLHGLGRDVNNLRPKIGRHGLFSLVWQVLGSNQRRLSLRFYSPSLLAEGHGADQHIRRSRRHRAPPPSAMRPCAPGLVHGRGRKTHGRGQWERLRRPSARLFSFDLALQDSRSIIVSLVAGLGLVGHRAGPARSTRSGAAARFPGEAAHLR